VRHLSPEAFVELLAGQLRVSGVVVGRNYRFGYRAAGTAELLQRLGPSHGMQVRVLGLVGTQAAAAASEAAAAAAEGGRPAGAPVQQERRAAAEEALSDEGGEEAEAVSSSRVRDALAAGDLDDAARCLGRPYRLVVLASEAAQTATAGGGGGGGSAALRLPQHALLNQPPGPGRYPVWAAAAGEQTLAVLAPPRRAVLEVDEEGATLLGVGGDLLGHHAAQHLLLDFETAAGL
jgi:FAD synthase